MLNVVYTLIVINKGYSSRHCTSVSHTVIIFCQSQKSAFFYIAILTIRPAPLYTVGNLYRLVRLTYAVFYGAFGSPAYYSLAPQVHERTLTPSLS